MKNFMMRGVILAALLSSLILPASADWSSQDSTNLANIKSYTSDIKTAVTSGTLFTNVSAIKSSVANISSNVASIYTQIQAVANSTSSISSKAADIYTALGYNSSYSTRKVIPLLYNISEYLRTIDDDTSTLRTTLSAFQSDVLSRFSTVTSNQSAINTNLLNFKNAFSSFAGTDSGSVLGYLSSLVSTSRTLATEKTLKTLATEETLQTLATEETLSSFREYALEYLDGIQWSSSQTLYEFAMNLTSEGYCSMDTIWGMMYRLVEVFASDTERSIRLVQEDNISQVFDDFLNPRLADSSRGTSLRVSDFGSLSSVGSTAKDVASLNGQSSVDSFIDGFSESNDVGLGWFNFATRQALDVRASTASTYSLDDSDPYNMGDFLSHYDWVFGGAIE